MPAPQDQKPASVSREDFHKNPKETIDRAMRDGRVVIQDVQGRTVAAISVPTDRRPVLFE